MTLPPQAAVVWVCQVGKPSLSTINHSFLMKKSAKSRLLAALILSLCFALDLPAQSQPSDPECINTLSGGIIPRSAFITYGSGIKMKSQTRRTKLTIGQTVVGSSFSATTEMNFGYWSGFLVAPFPPFVTATQGELLDRIQISWAPNPLGPLAVGGYKISRAGVYLAQVDKTTRNYNDFNVIAGKPYNYDVRGINAYGGGDGWLKAWRSYGNVAACGRHGRQELCGCCAKVHFASLAASATTKNRMRRIGCA